MPVLSELGRWGKKNQEAKASLSYMIPCTRETEDYRRKVGRWAGSLEGDVGSDGRGSV